MDTFKIIGALPMSERIAVLKKEMLDESRYATIEQARIITKSYRQTEGQPRCIQRAKALLPVLVPYVCVVALGLLQFFSTEAVRRRQEKKRQDSAKAPSVL